jgi:hypothetical protein
MPIFCAETQKEETSCTTVTHKRITGLPDSGLATKVTEDRELIWAWLWHIMGTSQPWRHVYTPALAQCARMRAGFFFFSSHTGTFSRGLALQDLLELVARLWRIEQTGIKYL